MRQQKRHYVLDYLFCYIALCGIVGTAHGMALQRFDGQFYGSIACAVVGLLYMLRRYEWRCSLATIAKLITLWCVSFVIVPTQDFKLLSWYRLLATGLVVGIFVYAFRWARLTNARFPDPVRDPREFARGFPRNEF